MKKVIRLTESDLTRIVKRVINESLGISDESKKLANIIMENLSKLENEDEISIEEGIDILNIKEIILKNRGGMNPYFNQHESIIIDEGVRLVFGLSPKDDYSTILHESFHGIDFIYKKGNFSEKLPQFIAKTTGGLSKLLSVVTPKHALGMLLYLLSDEEVKAHLHGAYADGVKYYKTLEGSKEEKREKLYNYINKKNGLYQTKIDGGFVFVRFSDFYELLNKLSKSTLQELTYGYYNENGENNYTRLLGILNHYFKMKPKFDTVTDEQIEKFKKELSQKLESGYNRFRKGLGRIVMLIEDEYNK
jgi:hypothetical protein